MKEIVEAQKKWQKAKDQARRICLERGKSDLADRISVCTMFKGTESLDDAASLVFSAQGSEFMTRFGFPSLDTFRSFLKFNAAILLPKKCLPGIFPRTGMWLTS